MPLVTSCPPQPTVVPVFQATHRASSRHADPATLGKLRHHHQRHARRLGVTRARGTPNLPCAAAGQNGHCHGAPNPRNYGTMRCRFPVRSAGIRGMGIRDFRVWEARPIRKCPAADHPGLVAFASLVKAASRATRRGTSALRRFTKHAGGLPKRRAVRDGPA